MIICNHNTNKPEDNKMKTNRNIFSNLSKASFIIVLAFCSLITVSCQNAARQSFHYKTDFIKQMIYKISNEFYTRTDESSTVAQYKVKVATTALVDYKISDKNNNLSSETNENSLADFLTHAAQLNAPVAEVEVENDNTLDFLTTAAQLNAPVADMVVEQDNTLDFLTTAAQLYAPVAQDNNSSDDTLDFLINAAQLNDQVADETNIKDNDLLDFLTQAAHLNESVAE
jgi:hypothetical protein